MARCSDLPHAKYLRFLEHGRLSCGGTIVFGYLGE